MSGDPAVKDRLEKALAEVGLGGVVIVNPTNHGYGPGWGLAWNGWDFDLNAERARLLWRAWRLALAGTEHPSCCEQCYVDNALLPTWERSGAPLTRCAGGDCPHGNEPGDFWREPVAS